MKTVLLTLVTVGALGSAACAKPKAPQLTPKEVAVTAVDLAGFDVRVRIDAFNPNGFAISVRSIVARVVLDGAHDLGTATVPAPVTLPANAHTMLDVPMNVKWKGLGGLASLAQGKRAVPFTVDGTANVGGETLNVDVPFKLEGKITPDQAAQAAAKSLQGIPALQGLPGLAPPR